MKTPHGIQNEMSERQSNLFDAMCELHKDTLDESKSISDLIAEACGL